MSADLQLRILTPAGPVLEVEQVAWVSLRLVERGQVDLLPGQAPLAGEIEAGHLMYADPRGPHFTVLDNAVVHADGEQVAIYTLSQPGRGGPELTPAQRREMLKAMKARLAQAVTRALPIASGADGWPADLSEAEAGG